MNTEFLSPRYWPVWLAIFILRALVSLPTPAAFLIGRLLGRIFYFMSRKRRKIAEINIAICFPQLPKEEQALIVRKHFESLGMSLISMGIGWWKNDRVIQRLVKMEGREHLDQAIEDGHGVILLSAHFNSLDISGRLFTALVSHPVYAVYQANSNPLIDETIVKNRSKSVTGMISHKDIRQMIYKLKENAIVWYAPDQGYKGKYSELVPFFGEAASSNTATSRLAKLSRAKVLPFFTLQGPDHNSYTIKILPPLEDFPTNDPVADTLKYHQILEREITKAPEQYLWIHRRFKGRPTQYPDLYQDIVLRK